MLFKSFCFNSKYRFFNGLGVMLYGMPRPACPHPVSTGHNDIDLELYKKEHEKQITTIHAFVASLPKEHRDPNNNLIVLIKDDNTFEYFPTIKGLKVEFRNNGKNNTVILYEGTLYDNCKLILSNENICIIEKSKFCLRNLSVLLQISKNSIFKVGKNFLCWGVEFQSRDGRHFILGDNILISYGISIWNGDGHTILDEYNKAINHSKDVFIGNNVWIGHRAEILKGTVIQDNSVVGACSVVNRAFYESNVIIAGQPAKIVKHGITWDPRPTSSFPPNV